MRRVVALLVLGAIAVVALATSASAAPALVRSALSPAESTTRFLAATDTATGRRALGLPSLAAILGSGAEKAARTSRRRLVQRLERNRTAPRAAAVQQAVRSGLTIRTPVQARDTAGEAVKATETLSGRGRQSRTLEVQVTANQCPLPPPVGSPQNNGVVSGRLLALYRVRTTERFGRVERTITVELRLKSDFRGSVNRQARLTPGISFPGDLRFTYLITYKDLRTGRVRSAPGTEVDVDITAGGQIRRPDAFQRFVDRDDDPPDGSDAPAPPGPQRTENVEQAVEGFLLAMADRAEGALKVSEQVWRTPNTCVQIDLEPPGSVIPGAVVPLRPTFAPGPVQKVSANNQDYVGSRSLQSPSVFVTDIGGATSSNSALTLTPAGFQTDVATPGQAWPASQAVGVDIDYVGPAGIARREVRFAALDGFVAKLTVEQDFSWTYTATSGGCVGTGSGTQKWRLSEAPGQLPQVSILTPTTFVPLANPLAGTVERRGTESESGTREPPCAGVSSTSGCGINPVGARPRFIQQGTRLTLSLSDSSEAQFTDCPFREPAETMPLFDGLATDTSVEIPFAVLTLPTVNQIVLEGGTDLTGRESCPADPHCPAGGASYTIEATLKLRWGLVLVRRTGS